METYIRELLTPAIMEQIAGLWQKEGINLKLLGRVENFVFETKEEKPLILRITHSSHRNVSLVEAELSWLNFLLEKGISVARPVISRNNNFVETLPVTGSEFYACAFEKAPGKFIKSKMVNDLDLGLVRNLGRLTGKIHRVTQEFNPPGKYRRPEWFEEDLTANARVYLNGHQKEIADELESLISLFKSLPQTKGNYGLVHADIHGGNFVVEEGRITLFDFDDSCYHFNIYDIGIILYSPLLTIADKQERDDYARAFFSNFLEGYREENFLDTGLLNYLPEVFRIREILLYIFYIKKWNFQPENEWQKFLFDTVATRVKNKEPLISFAFLSEYNK